MDETTLEQFNQILRELRKVVYSIKMPEFMLFDIDATLLDAYGRQEGAAFNYHYQSNGYHPLFAYDGLTGDLIKAELRDGTKYCSRDADAFMRSLLEEFMEDFPDIPLYLRGDSGFASPDLYEVLEEKGCEYAIRAGLFSKIGSGGWHWQQIFRYDMLPASEDIDTLFADEFKWEEQYEQQ